MKVTPRRSGAAGWPAVPEPAVVSLFTGRTGDSGSSSLGWSPDGRPRSDRDIWGEQADVGLGSSSRSVGFRAMDVSWDSSRLASGPLYVSAQEAVEGPGWAQGWRRHPKNTGQSGWVKPGGWMCHRPGGCGRQALERNHFLRP